MNKKSIVIGVLSFLIVLFTMPLGHAIMILLEHFLEPQSLYYAAFAIGAIGLLLTIVGVFVKGDTRQTLYGLFGGLLFWTGWIEFGYAYFAHRYGVEPLTNPAGEVVTKPEYLIMPSSIGFWVMFMFLYLFSIKSGCRMFMYLQKLFFRNSNVHIKIKPITHHAAIVTFMELNMMLWTSYLVLLFCYDDHFLGDTHPVTVIVAALCLAGSTYMFIKLLQVAQWGYSIRYAIATVIVFWTFVEVLGRRDVFKEIWVHPLEYKFEMMTIGASLLALLCILIYKSSRKRGLEHCSPIETALEEYDNNHHDA